MIWWIKVEITFNNSFSFLRFDRNFAETEAQLIKPFELLQIELFLTCFCVTLFSCQKPVLKVAIFQQKHGFRNAFPCQIPVESIGE